MAIYISYSGVSTKPVFDIFEEIKHLDNIEKVYLIYSEFDKDGKNSTVETKNLAELITKTARTYGESPDVRIDNNTYSSYGGDNDLCYNDFLHLRYMENKDVFNYDKALDKIIRISAENKNPQIYFNITNGVQPFTCAISVAAHHLGGSLYYSKLDEHNHPAVIHIKDCEKPEPDNLGKTEKDILRAIGQIYDSRERIAWKNLPDTVAYREHVPERECKADNSEREKAAKMGLSPGRNIPPKEMEERGFFIKQSDIYNHKLDGERTLSSSLVSSKIHRLADKHLILIYDLIETDSKGRTKVNRKEHAVELTIMGRMVYSRI